MLPTLRALTPLLLAASLLLGAGGLVSTVLSLGGKRAGFDPTLIGLIGSGYFAGYIVGCFVNPWLVKAVGHIRVFAALSAVTAASTLLFPILEQPVVWIALRGVMGFCFSGLFMVMEGWLNAASSNETRARVFSVYRIVDMCSVALGQYLMPIVGVEGFVVFSSVAMLTCLSVVPVSLADRSSPRAPEEFKLNLASIWRISPFACAGCFFVGLSNTGFRFIAPIYVEAIGFSLAQIATFLSIAVLASAIMQFPLGYISDRVDRRIAVMAASAGASLAAVVLAFAQGDMRWLIYAAAFVYGGLSLPLYPLLASHANDRAKQGQYVVIAAGLSFFFSMGALAGPVAASELYALHGQVGLFGFLTLCQLCLLVLSGWRYVSRPPAEER